MRTQMKKVLENGELRGQDGLSWLGSFLGSEMTNILLTNRS